MTCAHENFAAKVDVNRLTKSDEDSTIIGYAAEVHIWCAECDETFVFVGAPVGLLGSRPTMSVDGTELRAPIRPQSADPHFGMGLPGFAARIREGQPGSEN